jgi:tetratricopeptide (TPR) repeat protein
MVLLSILLINEENYRSKVLKQINKNIELSLFATDIDYFELDLLKNPNGNLCIHRKLKSDRFPSLNFQLGNRYYLAASYKEAIEKYKLAIEELEQLENSQKFIIWKVYCNLALAYNAIGERNKAKEAAKKCLEINPNVDAARKILTVIK